MAYSTALADRVRYTLGTRSGLSERAMFGGLALMVDGKMFVAISDSELICRVGPEHHQDALAMPHVREMDFTGRPMRGYVYVGLAALAAESDLRAWVTWCVEYVAALPPKASKRSRA